jgi:hypothetical protein
VVLELIAREREGSNSHLNAVERKLTPLPTAASAYVAILAGLGGVRVGELFSVGVVLGGLAPLVVVLGL